MHKREYNNGKMRMMRKYREDRAVSLRQLADALDINYTTISHWENGKRTPDEANAEKLEKFFDMKVEKLMEEIPEDEK